MAPPSRKQLKKAMLAILLSKSDAEKKEKSRKFTRMLFDLVASKMPEKDEEEVYMKQMEALGLFTNYIFRKSREKSQSGKNARSIITEISEESDELFEEIESSI
ncbi:hypothetical protein GF412_05215 [Candidatus Micrarchaeota archaeon]|nr:hypothetical protein [Candidatus Micrarchaeota archaeon]MBD3418353.1 hypothetical protein [Candidatus Micrarchaeota archaeon]